MYGLLVWMYNVHLAERSAPPPNAAHHVKVYSLWCPRAVGSTVGYIPSIFPLTSCDWVRWIRYPVVLDEFSIRKGSGGVGKYRGGAGVLRRIRFNEAMEVNILANRRK
eukprot:5266062-Pyramimonas_sp.AAC.1